MEGAMGDESELDELARKWRGTRVWTRVRAVILTRRGRTAAEVAEALGCCLRSVRQWLAAYRAGGAAALVDRPRAGRPARLKAEDEARLRARLDAGPTPADGVCTLRGEDIRRILAEEFGARYSVEGVYKLLHRLGYSSLAPRPRHRKADPEAQEAFKKGRPSGSRPSPRPDRENGSRSSSRTRPGSARRGR
jgi:transposase